MFLKNCLYCTGLGCVAQCLLGYVYMLHTCRNTQLFTLQSSLQVNRFLDALLLDFSYMSNILHFPCHSSFAPSIQLSVHLSVHLSISSKWAMMIHMTIHKPLSILLEKLTCCWKKCILSVWSQERFSLPLVILGIITVSPSSGIYAVGMCQASVHP